MLAESRYFGIDLFQTHHYPYPYEIGMIDDDRWQTWVLAYEDAITTWTGFRGMVQERRRLFRPSFRRFVDERLDLADSSPTPGVNAS